MTAQSSFLPFRLSFISDPHIIIILTSFHHIACFDDTRDAEKGRSLRKNAHTVQSSQHLSPSIRTMTQCLPFAREIQR